MLFDRELRATVRKAIQDSLDGILEFALQRRFDHFDRMIARNTQTLHAALAALRKDIMAVSAAIKDFSDRFDVATTEIAKDLAELRARATLPPEDQALLDSKIAQLTEMGKDPENPIPVEPPV